MERLEVGQSSKAWATDLENIPLFFVLGGLCVALETSTVAMAWWLGGFTLARLV
ncbi:hypothetical protein [Pseudomonas sp. S1_E04]